MTTTYNDVPRSHAAKKIVFYTMAGLFGMAIGYGIIVLIGLLEAWIVLKPFVVIIELTVRVFGVPQTCEDLGSIMCIFAAEILFLLCMSLLGVYILQMRRKALYGYEPARYSRMGAVINMVLLLGVAWCMIVISARESSMGQGLAKGETVPQGEEWVEFESNRFEGIDRKLIILKSGEFFVVDPNELRMKVLRTGMIDQYAKHVLMDFFQNTTLRDLGSYPCQSNTLNTDALYSISVYDQGAWDTLMNICSNNQSLSDDVTEVISVLKNMSE